MATHSSTLAWNIPWTEEPGRLQSMGSLRFRYDWVSSLSLFTFIHWRRKWQPTPVFLPGESQGWGSLVGCRLWGLTDSDMTEATKQQQQIVPTVIGFPGSLLAYSIQRKWHSALHLNVLACGCLSWLYVECSLCTNHCARHQGHYNEQASQRVHSSSDFLEKKRQYIKIVLK